MEGKGRIMLHMSGCNIIEKLIDTWQDAVVILERFQHNERKPESVVIVLKNEMHYYKIETMNDYNLLVDLMAMFHVITEENEK